MEAVGLSRPAKAGADGNDAPRGKPRGIICTLPLDGRGKPHALLFNTFLAGGGRG